MNALEILQILTNRNVFCRITNLKVDATDNINGQMVYCPQYKVTVGKDGVELATFMGLDLNAEMQRAYQWLIDNKVINNAPVYLPQCHDCIYRIGGQVLDVCKDVDSPSRHHNWHYTNNHDHCLYKVWVTDSRFTDGYLRSVLNDEQYATAISIINAEREKTAKK